MSAWETVPCLLALRDEFNKVSPRRDKGADGTIGDSNHTSSSDHTPDEDSDVLRGRDADKVNEVHALDIDSSGPWPEPGWFNRSVLAVVAREKAEYEHPTILGRLQNVIWNGRIASRSWGWTWRPYGGADPHTNHAHFSARYLTETERDTRPWGVYEEDDDMPTADEIAKAVWNYREPNPLAESYTGPAADAPDATVRMGGALRTVEWRAQDRQRALFTLIAGIVQPDVDEAELATRLADAFRETLGASLAVAVADVIHDRMAN